MEMTAKQKKDWINEVAKYATSANSKYFGGKVRLNEIEFKLSARMVNCLGLYKVKAGKQSITLNCMVLNDIDEWRNTVTHELVHAFQYQTGLPLDHGSSFRTILHRRDRIFKNEKISNLISAKKMERVKKHNQYLLKRPNGTYGFMKNLDSGDVRALYQNKFEVFKIKNPVPKVQHYQNLRSCFNANYSYDKKVLDKVYPTLFVKELIPVLYS